LAEVKTPPGARVLLVLDHDLAYFAAELDAFD